MSETTVQSPAPNESGTGPGGTTTDPIVPEDLDPRSFLCGYDVGENVGLTRGHIMGHRQAYAMGLEDGAALNAAQLDAERREDQAALNRALVEQVIRRGNFAEAARKRGQPERASRQEWLIETNGVTA